MRRVLSYLEQVFVLVALVLALYVVYAAYCNWRAAAEVDGAGYAFGAAEFQTARDHLNAALDYRPDDAYLLLFKGATLSLQESYSEAEKVLREALKRRGRGSDEAFAVALASALLFRSGGASTEAEAHVAGVRGPDACVVRAALRILADDAEGALEAIEAVERAGAPSQHGLLAYYLLASRVYAVNGRCREAVDFAMRLMTAVPKPGRDTPRASRGLYNWFAAQSVKALASAVVAWLDAADESEFDTICAAVERLFDRKARARYGIAANFWVNSSCAYVPYLALADAAFKMGRAEQALGYYKIAASRLRPAQSDVKPVLYYDMGVVWRKQAERKEISEAERRRFLDQAALLFAQAAGLRGAGGTLKYHAYMEAARCRFLSGQYHMVLTLLDSAAAAADRAPGVDRTLPMLARAVCLDRMRRYREARKAYRALLDSPELPLRDEVQRREKELQGRSR